MELEMVQLFLLLTENVNSKDDVIVIYKNLFVRDVRKQGNWRYWKNDGPHVKIMDYILYVNNIFNCECHSYIGLWEVLHEQRIGS